MYYQQNYNYNPYNNQFNEMNAQRFNEKRRLRTISNYCGGAVVAFVVLGIISGALLLSSQQISQIYKSNSVFESSVNTVLSLLTLALPFFIAYSSLKQKGFIGELPFNKPWDKKEFFVLIPVCVMICIIGSFATGVFSTVVDAWFNIEFTQPADDSTYTTITGVLLSVFTTAVVPAFIEEFAIRGVVMQSLRRYGDGFAIIMSSVVFALMHGNMVQIPFAFIAGIAIGYAVVKTRTIWTGIIIHFINNALSVAALTVSDNFSETVNTVFIFAMYAVVFVIGIFCAFSFTKKNPKITACLSKGQSLCLSNSEKTMAFIGTAPMIIAIGFLVYETSMYIN